MLAILCNGTGVRKRVTRTIAQVAIICGVLLASCLRPSDFRMPPPQQGGAGCPSYSTTGVDISCANFRGATYVVVRVDLKSARVKMLWRNQAGAPFKNLKAVGEQFGDELIAATNAGIYTGGFRPEGLHVERGEMIEPLNLRDGEGNFYWKPNGVFYTHAGEARIVESSLFASLTQQQRVVDEATQSGPLLISDNRMRQDFKPESTSVNVRNGVGVSSADAFYMVITKDEVNLYDFASFFREQLKCTDALYLDGCISQLYVTALGAYVPEQRRCDKDFVGVLGVFRNS